MGREIIRKAISRGELESLRVNDSWKCDLDGSNESVDVVFIGRKNNVFSFAPKHNLTRVIKLNVSESKKRIWSIAKVKRL